MYYVENEKVYKKHNFLQLAGVKEDRVTTDPFNNNILTIFDTYHFSGTTQRDNIKQIIRQRKEKNLHTKILYEYSYETGIGDHVVNEYVSEITNETGLHSSEITFILHKGSKDFLPISFNKYRFYFLDHFALKLYSKYITKNVGVARKPLVDRKIAINIMVAQLHWKKTRLHTLYHLYKENLLQTAITGIITKKENIASLEHEILDKEFWNWLYEHLGPADSVEIRMGHDSLISSGFPYSIDTYNNSRVTHICETLCKEMKGTPSFLTEKTYKPILNMSPFVLQGGKNHLDYLRSMDFHVFDKYANLDYDRVDFEFEHIPQTVQATKDLLLATINHPHEIEQSTQHNFRRLMTIGKQEYNMLRQFLGEK